VTPERELADRIAWHEMSRKAAADEAMRAIWQNWFSYYDRHFRGRGIAISMADQQAFFEIAQPILRELVSPVEERSSNWGVAENAYNRSLMREKS
jgi:hypothetical protein